MKNIFINGPISPEFISNSIEKHSVKTEIGGHSIFLGQVRADDIEGKQVKSIHFTTYEEVALQNAHKIREEIFEKYSLICAHMYHSIGDVKVGEICFFVFASSKHRADAMGACSEIAERFKKEVAIWGKEIFEDNTYTWKENK